MAKQLSTAARVREVLRNWEVGTVFCIDDVAKHLPHEERNKISAALSVLSMPKYGGLKRLPKVGLIRHYRLLKRFEKLDIRDYHTPAAHTRKREKANGEVPARPPRQHDVTWVEPEPNPDEPASTADVLMVAAMEYEEGNLEAAMESARQGYLRMKREQKLLAMKGKLQTR